MSAGDLAECCPRFDPEPWDNQELEWQDKLFVKDRVRSILHIPLNFGGVMKRNVALIEKADAKPESMVVLSDESSLWGSDVYIEATKHIPGADMATISGMFLSKVFEGPYRDMKKWVEQINDFAQSRGKSPKKLYFFYTTCPKCAKKYGENYVVLLAQV